MGIFLGAVYLDSDSVLVVARHRERRSRRRVRWGPVP